MASIAAEQVEDRIRRMLPVSAPPAERRQMAELHALLRDACRKEVGVEFVIKGVRGTRELPASVVLLLDRMLDVMARGEGVSVVSVPEELTTQQAADMLNVSRQYLARLLDAGRIPSRRTTGNHRRIAAADVLAFKRDRDIKRREGLRRLTQLTEELGGYDAELKKP